MRISCINENEIDSFTNSINNELNNVYLWLCANKIVINEEKTKYMIFSYSKTPTLSEIKIGNNIIPLTRVTKFLGVHIDSSLKFDSHINIKSNKLSKSIGLLYKYFPKHVHKILYSTLLIIIIIGISPPQARLRRYCSEFKSHFSLPYIIAKSFIH